MKFKVQFESRKIMSLRTKIGNPSAFHLSEVKCLSKFKLDEIGLLLDIKNKNYCHSELVSEFFPHYI